VPPKHAQMIGLFYPSNLVQIGPPVRSCGLKGSPKMRKQKMGDSHANNSKTAEDGAKVTAGVK